MKKQVFTELTFGHPPAGLEVGPVWVGVEFIAVTVQRITSTKGDGEQARLLASITLNAKLGPLLSKL